MEHVPLKKFGIYFTAQPTIYILHCVVVVEMNNFVIFDFRFLIAFNMGYKISINQKSLNQKSKMIQKSR